MNAKEAVARRIEELCEQHGIAINALANQVRGVSVNRVQYAEFQKPESRRCFDQKAL